MVGTEVGSDEGCPLGCVVGWGLGFLVRMFPFMSGAEEVGTLVEGTDVG